MRQRLIHTTVSIGHRRQQRNAYRLNSGMRFTEILDETAARPTRIMQHIRSGVPFIIASANRGNLSPEENKARTKQMWRKLMALPVSVIPFDFGEYQEAGQDAPSREQSFFILGDHAMGRTPVERLKQLAWKLRRDYDQDSVAFGDGKDIFFLERDGSEAPGGNAASFALDNVRKALGFSQIKGRQFTFTTDKDAPQAVRYGQQPRQRAISRPSLP